MRKYKSGDKAPAGIYVSLGGFDICVVNAEDSELKGKCDADYIRLSFPLLIVLGPVIGGMFALAFPLVIFGAVGLALWEKLFNLQIFTVGDTVDWGVYVNMNKLSIKCIKEDNARLEGATGTKFAKMPGWLLALLSPFVGAAYVVIMPMVMIGSMMYMLAKLSAAGLKYFVGVMADNVSSLTQSSFKPGISYLSKPRKDEPEEALSEDLIELEEEVKQARENEKIED